MPNAHLSRSHLLIQHRMRDPQTQHHHDISRVMHNHVSMVCYHWEIRPGFGMVREYTSGAPIEVS